MKKILSIILALAMCLMLVTPAQAYSIGSSEEYAMISSGRNYCAVIKTDGSLWTWGDNTKGQLGIGDKHNKEVEAAYNEKAFCQTEPVKVLDNVVKVSSGWFNAAAIKNDGSLWTWGQNSCGVLGDGTDKDRSTPAKVMDQVESVSCGMSAMAAIKTDGSLWMWGDNRYAQFGNGTTSYENCYPTKVLDHVTAVSCGQHHTGVIKDDGSLWMCGMGTEGQLGNGTNKNSTSFVKIMDHVTAISCGGGYSAAIKDDGSLWTWGTNSGNGILGNGTGWNSSIPGKIMDDVVAVNCGDTHTVAIKSDGSLWTWGNNSCGQLGDGTTEAHPSPVKVMDDVLAVSCGEKHTMVVKTDGSLWTCGSDQYGQLGYEGSEEHHETQIAIVGPPPAHQVTLEFNYSYQASFRQLDVFSVALSSKPAFRSVAPTSQKLTVNGEAQNTEIYNIDGSNYFKLRDMAALLNGTGSQFSVDYDAARSTIVVKTGEAYNPVGGELAAGTDKSATTVKSAQSIEINGQRVDLTAFNIGGNNFFKLRELGTALGFDVDYNTATATMIVTSK